MKAKPYSKRLCGRMGGALALAIVLPFLNAGISQGADPKGDSHSAKRGHSAKATKNHEKVKEDPEALAKGKAHQVELDMATTNAVKNSILFHFLLNTKVDTLDGVVTLTGRAATSDEKNLNTTLASKTSGVKKVVNLMDVSSSMVTSN